MKDPSPLLVWKLLLIVLVTATIAMLLANDPMNAVVERSDGILSRKLSTLHFADDETGIIFFGNSLLNQALPVREEVLNQQLVAELRNKGYQGKPISTVELTTGGINARRLQALGSKLIEAEPSIIVLQSEMFVSRKPEKRWNVRPAERIATWSGVLNLRIFGTVQKAGENTMKRKQVPGVEKGSTNSGRVMRRQKEDTLAAAREVWENQVASTTTPEFIGSRRLVQRASEMGIHVIVVELPVSETAAKFASDGYLQERRRVIGELSMFGVVHLTYPRTLPDDYFRDYSHLNAKGRKEFIRWFYPALTQALLDNEIV